jgi:diguanylate cyclase
MEPNAPPHFPATVKRFFSALYAREADSGDAGQSAAIPEQGTDLRAGAPNSKAALLHQISSFFTSHDLHLSGTRMQLVHDMLSGGNADLTRRYEARLKSPLGFNDGWMEAVEHEQTLRHSANMDKLVGEFDKQLSAFRSNTRDARKVSETYSDELAQQIETDLVEQADMSALSDLAKKMLKHSQQLTAAIKSNEQDTEKLQRRLNQAKQDAQTDQLTGLPNRRAFEDQFRQYCEIAIKKRAPLCLAFCDIDNFKLVNDQHGHETGDRVLKMVSDVLNKLSKTGSFVSRHGGEEFVLLFSGTSLDKAAKQLDAARAQLAQKELVNRDTNQRLGMISFSAGIVNVMDFDNPRDGLQAADAALYRAKHAGKNQVLKA